MDALSSCYRTEGFDYPSDRSFILPPDLPSKDKKTVIRPKEPCSPSLAYYGVMTREASEAFLHGKPPGTYLSR